MGGMRECMKDLNCFYCYFSWNRQLVGDKYGRREWIFSIIPPTNLDLASHISDGCRNSSTGGCYWIELRRDADVNLTEAHAICSQHDSVLSAIPDENMYREIQGRIAYPNSAIWVDVRLVISRPIWSKRLTDSKSIRSFTLHAANRSSIESMRTKTGYFMQYTLGSTEITCQGFIAGRPKIPRIYYVYKCSALRPMGTKICIRYTITKGRPTQTVRFISFGGRSRTVWLFFVISEIGRHQFREKLLTFVLVDRHLRSNI